MSLTAVPVIPLPKGDEIGEGHTSPSNECDGRGESISCSSTSVPKGGAVFIVKYLVFGGAVQCLYFFRK